MSFFRNIRTSMTRGKSTSRDSTPVRAASITGGSMTGGRRDSLESRTDSIFNRSDTFILNSDADDKNHSNTSTLEKKSKKSKVLSKFSTFTKRKKSPPSTIKTSSLEHHPSENATNTYYKWQSEAPNVQDYDSQSDPFNFLYEQPSSLKALQNAATYKEPTRAEVRGNSASAMYDSSTYRKNKMPTQLKEQLEPLKTQTTNNKLQEEELRRDDECEKYKTVTINSFRKSFRDKFLTQQKDAPHNPAWFVEVPKPPEQGPQDSGFAKENRTDFLVFENDNYRPESRSPVRDRSSRSMTRSPVKRNETFRVERPTTHDRAPIQQQQQQYQQHPSIRIEIKNSITPNVPGRMVPVGVAKPMPSTAFRANYYSQNRLLALPNGNTAPITSTKRTSNSPLRGWSKPTTNETCVQYPSATNSNGRYQTLVQIRNESNPLKPAQQSPLVNRRSLPTRIQLHANTGASNGPSLRNPPTTQWRPNISHSARHALHPNSSVTLTSYEILKNSNSLSSGQKQSPTTTKPLKTYFGGSMTAAVTGSSGCCAPALATSKLHLRSAFPTSHSGYASRRNEQQQHMTVPVPVQRRSRSPIKMPWR